LLCHPYGKFEGHTQMAHMDALALLFEKEIAWVKDNGGQGIGLGYDMTLGGHFLEADDLRISWGYSSSENCVRKHPFGGFIQHWPHN
jgi:hypothetical protein